MIESLVLGHVDSQLTVEEIDQNNPMHEEDTIDCIQSSLYAFGIAINGGTNGFDNQSLIISDVIKNGPADGKLLPNDRIVNVNGHPVVRSMEYTALKLIRDSTDFVHLIVQRRQQQQHPIIVEEKICPTKCVLNKTRKEEKFGLIIDCRYFIQKILSKTNPLLANIHEGDEIIQINNIPIDRLTLQEAQKLIDKSKGQVILHTIPNKLLQTPAFFPVNSGTRYVSFFTETSSIGIRLAGGNKYGLFICEIQANSIAYKSGLFIADRIFSVNKIDFTNLTREEAVLYLTNMKSSEVKMIVSNSPYEYEQLLADIGGDSFYVRAHFARHSNSDEELAISINDVFHVTDTLYNGQVGSWVATKLTALSVQSKLTGTIPNRTRAEELVNVAPSLGELVKLKQMSLRRKLRSKFSEKRSRSILSLNYLKDDSTFEKTPCWKPMISSKFSTYERVQLKPITIIRPVVLLGPLADIARDQLLNQYSDQFELPEIYIQSPSKSHTNIIKLQSIKNVIRKDRHCVLDITPSAIEQLNHAECYPIVIYFQVSDRRMIKQIRQEYGKVYQKSSRRLLESSERFECFYSYLFTAIIKLDSSINWFEILKAQIQLQQEQSIWMSNDRSISKDLLKSDEYFLSTNHFEEFPLNIRDLHRVASDPAMFRKDQIYSTQISSPNEDEDEISMQTSTISLPNRSHSVMEMPTTDKNQESLSYLKTNQLFRADRYMTVNPSKIASSNGSSIHLNPSRRPLMAPKRRPILPTDCLSSSDSNGSIRKTSFDKSTMTSMPEKDTSYGTWKKSTALPRSTISSETFNFYDDNRQSLSREKMINRTSIPVQHVIQKPRVFTYDDRNVINQTENILSSSSGSSTLSFKNKNIKEVGETQSYSVQDGCNMIGSARGMIDYYGGKLSCPLTGVSLFIPMGAISEGLEQEIYFQVCHDSAQIEKFNGQLFSPIVICGPQGLQFNKPIELTLPHSAGNDAQQLSLMLHGTNPRSEKFGQHKKESFTRNTIHHVTNSNVSVLLDHF